MNNNIYDKFPFADIYNLTRYGFVTENQNIKENYFLIRKKYYSILEIVLYEKLNLTYYEEKIKNSKYFSISKEHLNNLFFSKSQYFFLRSPLNIENMSIDEINTIAVSTDINVLKDVVIRTLKKVVEIRNWHGKEIKGGRILLDGNGESFIRNTTDLLLGSLIISNLNEENWMDEVAVQTEFMNNIFNEIKQLGKTKLNIDIDFVKFSEDTIKEFILNSGICETI